MIVLAAVFLFCAGTVAVVQHQYAINKRLYREASDSFTEAASSAPVREEEDSGIPNDGIFRLDETPPIKVDFKSLTKVNPDVEGWIYCPDTVIDYPVLHGTDNNQYLYHSYNKVSNASGSIFVDAMNSCHFADPVSVIYGHHMASGAMFATLDYWQGKDYFDAHPVMWLLTPTQDYKVELYSSYNTSAFSDTYSYFAAPGPDFTRYLQNVESYSAVHTGIRLDPNDHYIVLSTCAYVFDDARSVLHGRLRPVMSAGGVPFGSKNT